MKGKTQRKLKRFYETPQSTLGTIFTIGGFVAAILAVSLGWGWLMILVAILVVIIGGGSLYLYKRVSVPKLRYFEPKPIDFRAPDEKTIGEAIDSILNCNKAEPFYVHAAPEFDEVSTICSRLKETGFATISGKPGEGKSMAAYQAAYSLQKQEGFSIYLLDTGRLGDKRWSEIGEQIFYELDELLKGKRKIILIDDAHNLESKRDLEHALREEATENNCKYIWIETKEEYEESQPNDYIRINFQKFKDRLLEDFYGTKDIRLQKVLADHIGGLEDAMIRAKRGEIADVWHFNSCATQGWERLVQKFEDFKEDELVELLVLFFISAHTVLSRESEIHITDIIEKIGGLKFRWLSEQRSSTPIRDAIRELSSSKLIRIYGKERDRGYVRSLHYNFARDVIKACLLKESLAKYMLTSAKALLTGDYRQCVYYGAFHNYIGHYAAEFDRDNKDWLVGFLSNPLPEWLQCYPATLTAVGNAASDVYNEIIKELDIADLATRLSGIGSEKFQQLAYLLSALGDRQDEVVTELVKEPSLTKLAQTASAAEVGQFDQVAHLLDALGGRRDELLKDDNFDLSKLAQTASAAEVGQFQQVAYLLDALGGRRDELLKDDNFDLSKLAQTASAAEVGQFQQVAFLLNALGERSDLFVDQLMANDQKILKILAEKASCIPPSRFHDIAELLDSLGPRKTHLIALLDHNKLTETASEVGPHDISGLTLFMAQLDEEHRDPLVQRVDWASICVMCPIYAVLFKALGTSIQNLCKQAEISSDSIGVMRVTNHLRDHADEIKQEIARAHPNQYTGVAKFLWNCNQVDHSLAFEIAAETMDKLLAGFSTGPANYRGVGQLTNALYEIDPHLSASFINNKKVRGKIQQSINRGGWGENIEDLKHLIKAFYRSAPDLWEKMVSYGWIVVDLSSLDLDSIYRDINEEKSGGTAYNTT